MAKILMISLDKNILNKNSIVSQRMIEYGKENELFIIIPNKEKEFFDLSSTVHVQSTGGNKLRQFCLLKKIGKKLIKENKIEEISVQDPFFIGLVGWFLKRKFRIKLEAQMHGDFFGGYYKNQRFRLYLAKFILKQADTIRVAGERVRQSLLKLGIFGSKIELRPVVIAIEKIKNYQPNTDLHQKYPAYQKIFLSLGRLDPVKNLSWLLDLWSSIIKQQPNYLLLIVGDGVEKERLIAQIKANKSENNVKMENWAVNPWSYLKTTDCLLIASLTEGYGLTATEAAAVGTPIIMTNVGVANYELKPNLNVKIVPIGDRNKFIQAILAI